MTNSKKITTKQLALTAMFTAITVVLSQIAIPLPVGVPITLQTFAVAICGYILGYRLGTLSTFGYVVMGAVGLPVFASFKSGVHVLFGMTGGFIFGFILMALLCGLSVRYKNVFLCIALGLAGLVLCHVLGILQFSAVMSKTVVQSFALVSLPYILKDIVSVVAAYFVAGIVRKRLQDAHLISYAKN